MITPKSYPLIQLWRLLFKNITQSWCNQCKSIKTNEFLPMMQTIYEENCTSHAKEKSKCSNFIITDLVLVSHISIIISSNVANKPSFKVKNKYYNMQLPSVLF